MLFDIGDLVTYTKEHRYSNRYIGIVLQCDKRYITIKWICGGYSGDMKYINYSNLAIEKL